MLVRINNPCSVT